MGNFEVYGQNSWSDTEQLKYNSWGGCYKENTSNGILYVQDYYK